MDINSFPSNSIDKRNEEFVVRDTPVRVVECDADIREKPIIQRIVSTFLRKDTESLSTFVKDEVVKPYLADMAFDSIVGIAEMLLYENRSASRRGSRRNHDYTSHSTPTSRTIPNTTIRRDDKDTDIREDDRDEVRVSHEGFDIFFKDRVAAEDTIDSIQEHFEDYEYLSVLELYEIIGKKNLSKYTDNNFGWSRDIYLGPNCIRRVSGGRYRLCMPRPKALPRTTK